MIYRTDEVTSHAERVVYNERNGIVVRNLRQCWEVGDDVLWVSNTLDVDRLRVLVDCSSKVCGVQAGHELGVDAELFQEDLELVVGPAVQIGACDDVVTRTGNVDEGHELRRVPTGD